MSELDDIISRLRSVSEDLADRAISALSATLRAGGPKRPDSERALTQARRAVEKAIGLLERLPSSTDDA